MFFGSRKRHKLAGGVSHPSHPADNDAGTRPSRQWETWRRCAQKVTRTWNEWLAAHGRDRAELYRRYISALAEEERAAAEVQSTVSRGAQPHGAGDCTAATAHSGGNRREL
jgi:hypothetical protein